MRPLTPTASSRPRRRDEGFLEGTLKQVDTVQWYGLLARKEYQIGASISGFGLDDPDANFCENFSCTSIRNYMGYCHEQVMKLIDQPSQELDQKKRLASCSRFSGSSRRKRRAR